MFEPSFLGMAGLRGDSETKRLTRGVHKRRSLLGIPSMEGLDEAATRRKCGGNGAERFTLSAAPDLACGRILINRCDLAGERGLSIDREPWLE